MFTIKKISEDVYGFGEFYHNEEVISYLIMGEKMGILFDTGMGILDIKKEIEKTYVGEIIVINSHDHYDHIGGNHQFNKIYHPEKNKIIDIGKYKFEVIFTPGHSKDSLCLYEEKQGWLFAGDTIYDGPIYIENISEYISSLEKLAQLSIKKIFPGHNTFLEEKIIIYDILSKKTTIESLQKEEICTINNHTSIVKL